MAGIGEVCMCVSTYVLVRQQPQDPFPIPEASLESQRGYFQRSPVDSTTPTNRQSTSLPVKRHGIRLGTASSSYVPETLLKCFWARSRSCLCSTPVEKDIGVSG
jgi:hypothetical protein